MIITHRINFDQSKKVQDSSLIKVLTFTLSCICFTFFYDNSSAFLRLFNDLGQSKDHLWRLCRLNSFYLVTIIDNFLLFFSSSCSPSCIEIFSTSLILCLIYCLCFDTIVQERTIYHVSYILRFESIDAPVMLGSPFTNFCMFRIIICFISITVVIDITVS